MQRHLRTCAVRTRRPRLSVHTRIHPCLPCLVYPWPSVHAPMRTPSWRLERIQLPYAGLLRSDRHALQAPRGKGSKGDAIIMVDPLEAKRLAAKQMQEIQAKEKRKRQCRIEAINGAWAMIGLTAGLVVEGQTDNGILAQLVGYLEAIKTFFTR